MISLKKHCATLVFLSVFSTALAITPLSVNAAKRNTTRIAQLEFRDITVSDALKILSQQSNLNFVASQKAAEIHITLYFQSVNPLQVIDAIAKTYNLLYKYDEQTHIIRVYTVEEYQAGKVEFKQEETQVFTLKNAKNAVDLANSISNLYGTRVELNFDKNQNLLLQDLQERFARFSMLDNRKTLSTSIGGTTGGNTNNNGNNNNQQNNQNNGNNNNQQNNQNIGNTSITGNIGTNNTIQPNIQNADKPSLIYVSVIKHQNRVLVRTSDIEVMDGIKKLYEKLNNESSMMLLEVKILSLNLGDDFNSIFDFKLKGANSAVTGGQSATSALTTALTNAASAFNPALLATVVSQSFEARLQLLEKENRVTELATPVLMTTNQEVSRIFIGEERPITTSFTTSGSSITTNTTNSNGTSNTTTTTATSLYPVFSTSRILPVTEIRALGTTLLLTPNINSDRTVGINVLIEKSGLSPEKGTIPLPQTQSDGTDTISYVPVDVVQNKTFSGTVVAKDNTAIAVGGLISENASNSEGKVPVLGDVPGLGFFFREEAQTRGRQELVVIIKPHIIATPDEAAEVNQKFLQKNSVHPNSETGENLNVYTNPTGEHKDYRLEKPFKEYRGQDVFDKANQKGGAQEINNISVPARQIPEADVSTAQQIYVKLTRYAADGVRLPIAARKLDPKIQTATLPQQFIQVDLLYDGRIKALPIAAWHQGGIYVTAVELHNTANEAVKVDYRRLKGRWLAATIENDTLGQQSSANKSHITHLYLVSSQPFAEIVKTAGY